MSFEIQLSAQILIICYIIITFAYSAIEKLLQWKVSINFYNNHFKNTFLKNTISFFLKLVIFFELTTVFILIVGLYFLIAFSEKEIGLYGLIIAAITLIGLMLGQRFARDYAGAMTITVYFILTVFGVLIMQ